MTSKYDLSPYYEIMRATGTGEVLRQEGAYFVSSISGCKIPKSVFKTLYLEEGLFHELPETTFSPTAYILSPKGRSEVGLINVFTVREMALRYGTSLDLVWWYIKQDRLNSDLIGRVRVFSPKQAKSWGEGRESENGRDMPKLYSTKDVAKILGVNFPVLQKRMRYRICYGIPLDRRGRGEGGGTAVFTDEMIDVIRPIV